MAVTVKAPASSANLGPGFDVLGLAVALYNTVELEEGGPGLELAVTGEGEGVLDRLLDENLAVTTIDKFYTGLGRSRPPLRIRMDNRVPLSRGLGSSAATIVAALAAANELSGAGLSKDRLFDLAVDIEGHADNVAAAVYGGLTIAYRRGASFQVRRLDPAAGIGVVVMVPDTSLSTAKARAALPDQVSREAAVFNVGRTALLIEALLSGDLSAAGAGLEDALHQPWRRPLIDDFDVVTRAALEAGAVGAFISGAGPTVAALYDRTVEADMMVALPAVLAQAGSRRRALFLDVDTTGVVLG